MAEHIEMDLTSGITSILEGLLVNNKINNNGKTVNAKANVEINQKVIGTKQVQEATQSIKDYNKAISGIPKNIEQKLNNFKSSSIREALRKIEEANYSQKDGELVSMINAYKVQFKDWDSITENTLKGIDKIKNKYNELIKKTNKDGQLTYGENYVYSIERLQALFDQYKDWKPSITFKLNLNIDEENAITQFEERKNKLLEKLSSLDKGKTRHENEDLITKQVKEFYSENILNDRIALSNFVEYYTELERVIEVYGGEIPERIKEIYKAIEKENKEGQLRINSAMQRGNTNYNSFIKSLKNNNYNANDSNIDTNSIAFDLHEKATKIIDEGLSKINEGIKKKGVNETYYENFLGDLNIILSQIENTRNKIEQLDSNSLSENNLDALNRKLHLLESLEISVKDKISEVKKIFDSIDFTSEKQISGQNQEAIFLGAGEETSDEINDTIKPTEELLQLLKQLNEEISNINKSLLTIDGESGIQNLLSQFETLLFRIQDLQDSVSKINFNVVINDPSSDDEFWNKQLQRYRDYFQKAVKRLGGMDFAYNAISQSSYVGDFNQITNRFNQEAMDNSNLKPEQIIQNYQEFFKYLKEAAKIMREDTDDFSIAVKESVKGLPTDDIKALIRNNKKAKAKEGAGDRADAITQAINQALTGNKETEDIDISKHIGDLTGVIEDLKKIQELLNQISENKAISENVDRITLKLDAMQQSFRDLLRNLNESIKSNQPILDISNPNIGVSNPEKILEISDNIQILSAHLEEMKNLISEIKKAFDLIDDNNGLSTLLSQILEISSKLENIQQQLSSGILANNNNIVEAKFGNLSEVLDIIKNIELSFNNISSNQDLPLLFEGIINKLNSFQQSFRDLIHNIQNDIKNIKENRVIEGDSKDNIGNEKLVTLITELKDITKNIEIEPYIPHPKDFIDKIDNLLEGYFASIEIRPDFNPSNFINEIHQLVESEILTFSQLSDYLSINIPNAIEDKNNAFKNEGELVDGIIEEELKKLAKLKVKFQNFKDNVSSKKEKEEAIPTEETYIHYGSSSFDKSKFETILNSNDAEINKPLRGLWASIKEEEENGWRGLIETSNAGVLEYSSLIYSFMFKLKDKSRILKISNIKDIEDLPANKNAIDAFGNRLSDGINSFGDKIIDWEKIAERYDAIVVDLTKDNGELEEILTGWDVNSVVVLNPDAVIPIEVEKRIKDSTTYIEQLRLALFKLIKQKDKSVLSSFPELEKFENRDDFKEITGIPVKSLGGYTKEWLDFLATIPKAHPFLESIGYDFEKISQKTEKITKETSAAIEKEGDIVSQIEPDFDKATNAKKRFKEANQEVKESAELTEEQILAEAEAAKKVEQTFDGYYKNQRGIVGSDSWSYEQDLGYGQTKTFQMSGNNVVSEIIRTDFDKLANIIYSTDKQILRLQNDINVMSSKGIDTTPSVNKLHLLQDTLDEAEQRIREYFASTEYIPSSEHEQEFNDRRDYNRQLEKSVLQQKQQVSLDRAHKAALKENQKLNQNQVDDQNKKAIQLYKELYKTAKRYYELRAKNLTGNIVEREKNELNHLIQKWEEAKQGVDDYAKIDGGTDKVNKSYDEIRSDYDNQIDLGRKAIESELIKEYNNLQKIANNPKLKFTESFTNNLTNVLEILEKINKEGLKLDTDDDIRKLGELKKRIEEIYFDKELDPMRKASEQSIEKLRLKISDFMQKNSAMGKDFMSQFDNLRVQLDTADSKEKINEITTAFFRLENEVTKADKLGKSFFKTFGERIKSINAQFLAQYFSWQDLIRYARTVVNTVYELDTALVDLKKTTTMNNSELEEFYQNSSNIAKQTGVTTQEIISQASVWSRLGFSSQEAATQMAQLSSQFAQISPGTSVDDATDYLVSTMKAFHIEVEDVKEDVMSVVNRLGNTMATSNQEIGEMLARSSAAMAAANNSLAQTAALESAAVQITRNAETTGINSAA